VKLNRFLVLSCTLIGLCNCSWAGTVHVSLCSLQEKPERFLNSEVELVEALIFAGGEYPRITAGQCSFRYAYGDDYQTLGDRFPVKHNGEWKLLKELLGTTGCASNVRVAKAKIKGTIIRVPATGTVPSNEMPLELVIQSVSEVERVPVDCTPPASPPSSQAKPASSTLAHESGHIDPPSQR
jgi:hypothetical protein